MAVTMAATIMAFGPPASAHAVNAARLSPQSFSLDSSTSRTPYSQIIAFGDSLSDTGNLYKLTSLLPTGGIPGAPYYQGRFSNGLLAVEDMAAGLGLGLLSNAVAGAQTGLGNQGGALLFGTGVAGQITKFEARTPVLDTSALYFLWAGPNDFYVGANMQTAATSAMASANMLGNIRNLYDHGARNFFVPLMPDLSQTPEALHGQQAYADAARQRTLEYNQILSQGLSNLQASLPSLNLTVFDTPSFMRKTVGEMKEAGFDVTEACYDAARDDVCSFEAQYLFWDSVHPTNTGHYLLGEAFANAALTAAPEPGTWALMLLGLAAMKASVSRRSRARLH
jgi:phospholipase/lecithinase/hemolysin